MNRIEINRALSTAAHAIELMQARLRRRAQLPESVGKTWTEKELEQLRAEFARSEPIPDVAKKHKRTVRAIESRLESLGLLRADRRTTTDNAFTRTRTRRK